MAQVSVEEMMEKLLMRTLPWESFIADALRSAATEAAKRASFQRSVRCIALGQMSWMSMFRATSLRCPLVATVPSASSLMFGSSKLTFPPIEDEE